MRQEKRVLGLSLVALVIFLAGGVLGSDLCPVVTWNLTAGQHIDVGTVSVYNDVNNIYVIYTLTYPGATLGNLHTWIGNLWGNLPVNNNGIPVPGQFCQALGGHCYDASGLTTYTFTIPWSEVSLDGVDDICTTTLYVFTHAEVTMDSDGDGEMDSETAWGGPTPGGDGPRWYFYGEYPVCCLGGPPPETCDETAFAKGGWVWTTDKKSNPENLPSLALTRNRWGWAINLTGTGTTVYDIWAGAGLNYTSKGVKVGTLTVVWDGTTATVTYAVDSGFKLQEVHLYASDFKPTTTAPGQYGYLDSFEPTGVDTYTFTVPLAGSDLLEDGFWLIGHAVVSGSGLCR